MREQHPTTTPARNQRTPTHTAWHSASLNRTADEFDGDEHRVDDRSDSEDSRSKDEIESVERQRGSGSSSVRSEDDEESRDSFEPPSTSTSPQRVSSAGRGGGWSDTTSGSRDGHSATNSASTPSPLNRVSFVLDSSQGSHSRSYQLRVVQYPVTGAACGSLSRIPLAPPLFVQLIVKDASGNIIPADDDLPFLVAVISLHKANSYVPEDLLFNRQLNGTTVACPSNLQDMRGDYGIYFIFPDVGIGCCGQWKLRVSLMRIALLGAQSILMSGDVGECVAGIWTEPFDIKPQHVYVAPKITPLTKHFIDQGVRMFISSSVVPG